ncbi:hypothetical protein COK07_24135 [Bacillus thuringiensis]|uniref:AimR family lysis-lysogeny pheromone receptor n=1 Tax=Bacillus thuringiensis TaxID=1428 RepID=UPI000BF62724|nr:AimR family lysis-lysogeny pheromone receptor [Bacillus thuringiensis]PFP73369.1 hypothetical protein COK07_24135 [Bacillus thuringiensis]
MQRLLNKLHDDLFAIGITDGELAKQLQVGKSTISETFSGKRDMKFYQFSGALMCAYNDNHDLRRKMIMEYVNLNSEKDYGSYRETLEYTSYRGELDLLNTMIEKEKGSSYAKNREAAIVYEILYKRSLERFNGDELLNQLEDVRKNVKYVENSAMCDLLMCYVLYDTGNYRSILNYVKNAEEKVKQISVRKNRFIKSSYNHRIIEILSAIHLLRGNLTECREFSLKLIEQCGNNPQFNIQRVNAFCNLGESYIFSDYNKSLKYLQESLENLGDPFNQRLKAKKNLILQTMVFLKVYWDKPVGDLEVHPAEKAFLEIKLGNNKKAEDILMDLLKIQERLSAFQKLYLGLARNDRKLMEESLEIFEKKGNIFYSQLPKRYLGYF